MSTLIALGIPSTGGGLQRLNVSDILIASNIASDAATALTFNSTAAPLTLQIAGSTKLDISSTEVTVRNSAIFTGNGSGLTALNGANITAASIPLSGLVDGALGYVLTANGVGFAPSYQAPATRVNGSSSLAGAYNVTASYGNIGLSVSLPEAGQYLVFGEVRCQLQVNSGTGNITIRLFDSTASSAITESERITDYSANSVITGSTVPISEYVNVSGPSTIDVQAAVGAGSYLFAQVVSDGSGRSRLHYEKKGPYVPP